MLRFDFLLSKTTVLKDGPRLFPLIFNALQFVGQSINGDLDPANLGAFEKRTEHAGTQGFASPDEEGIKILARHCRNCVAEMIEEFSRAGSSNQSREHGSEAGWRAERVEKSRGVAREADQHRV